jgi:SRSO17 transposase
MRFSGQNANISSRIVIGFHLVEIGEYWFLTLPRRTFLSRLVYAAKGHWPIERDYEELKGIGLGDYEVRGWRGFHHHATMCIAAYAFLIAERGRFSPSPDRRESPTRYVSRENTKHAK